MSLFLDWGPAKKRPKGEEEKKRAANTQLKRIVKESRQWAQSLGKTLGLCARNFTRCYREQYRKIKGLQLRRARTLGGKVLSEKKGPVNKKKEMQRIRGNSQKKNERISSLRPNIEKKGVRNCGKRVGGAWPAGGSARRT